MEGVLDGVRLGDQVALTDVDNLADGMKVTVAKGDPTPAGDINQKEPRPDGQQSRTSSE